MALFRRAKRARRGGDPEELPEDTGVLADTDDSPEGADGDLAGGSATAGDRPEPPARPQGPWDEADAPADGPEHIDLGGLQVPLHEGAEVRIEVSPEGQVVGATVARGESSMQVQAFAAPRGEGIWDDVRQEIAAAVAEGGGQATELAGPLGPELHAEVPALAPDGSTALAPARFVGVDGPRWFLRAMLTGPAARDDAAAAPLLEDLRGVVVVRGGEAMVVRDPLPLRLPRDVQAAAEQAAAQAGRPAPAVPERGPEITEIG